MHVIMVILLVDLFICIAYLLRKYEYFVYFFYMIQVMLITSMRERVDIERKYIIRKKLCEGDVVLSRAHFILFSKIF